MGHPELAPISFVSLVLVLIPLPWHLRVRNVATVSTILWLAFSNLYHFVNALLWNGNVDIRAQVYCDISLSLFIAGSIALPAAALCIARHLEHVASPNHAPSNLKEKRNRFIFEIVMCAVLPIAYSAMHLIVQGHRFDIFEDLGCVVDTYISWPAMVLFYFPPLVLALVTGIYAGMSVRWLMQRRAQFRDLFPSASGMSSSSYFRLMALAIAQMLGTLGFTLYVIILAAVERGILPWVSWDFVHSNFGYIGQFPTAALPPSFLKPLLTLWSIIPIDSWLFFAFFGLGEEAMAEYRKYWRWICRVILRRNPNPGPSSGRGLLPSFFLRSSKTSGNQHKVEMSTSVPSREIKKWQKDDDSLFGDRLDVEAAKDVSSSYASFESRSRSPQPYTIPLDSDSEAEPSVVSVATSPSIHVSGPPSFAESEGDK